MLQGGYENIVIPEHSKWTVTLWHFGVDSSNYREVATNNHDVTWQLGRMFLAASITKRR